MKASPSHLQSWGKWTYDAERLVLVYNISYIGWWYEIDLERCRTSAAVLDWIFQVSMKRYITPQDTSDMIEAIRDVLDPQATLCSCGMERGPLNIEKRLGVEA